MRVRMDVRGGAACRIDRLCLVVRLTARLHTHIISQDAFNALVAAALKGRHLLG